MGNWEKRCCPVWFSARILSLPCTFSPSGSSKAWNGISTRGKDGKDKASSLNDHVMWIQTLHLTGGFGSL